MHNVKYALALALVCSLMSAFAQDEPEKPELKKFAVYVFGAGDAGINKSFGNNMLSSITQSGKYAGIENPEAFYGELAKNHNDSISQIIQIAKQYGADFVCAVSMAEAFGDYSFSARIIKTADSQVVRTGLLNHSLKSLDDLTTVSNELVKQLLQPPQTVPPIAAAPVPQKECKSTFNINEIVFKIQNGFPKQLKDCSADLARSMAPMPGFLKKSAGSEPKKPPKEFMTHCTLDGIKKEFPEGLDANKYIGNIENFLQNIMNAASAANGELDVMKLSKAVGNINIGELLDGIKNLAAADECVVQAPYEPPAAFGNTDDGGSSNDKKDDESTFSFGFRAGFNFSHLYATYDVPYIINAQGSYNSTPGFQLGFVLDLALSDWFHFQPGFMYIQKGTEDDNIALHYIEIPLLLSLKFSVFRINAGPYFGICVDESSSYIDDGKIDIGINAGLGFDIGMFYIGVFYDYGLTDLSYDYDGFTADLSDRRYFGFYNRTLGFNFGVNL
jgi:hypothetical protein